MRERPIGDLVDGLKQLGADADCILGTNCPPVVINANGGLPGGKVSFCLNPLCFPRVRVMRDELLIIPSVIPIPGSSNPRFPSSEKEKLFSDCRST